MLGLVVFAFAGVARPAPLMEEAISSQEDILANSALQEPDGPSLDFFKSLIPPLHYVNTDFQHYPIVLSAPNAPKKARLISNGSGINLRANTRAWNEPGTAVMFRVGNDELAYGTFLDRLQGPKWREGYLPIVQMSYRHGAGVYAEDSFASVAPAFSSNAVCLTRFKFTADTAGDKGRVVVRVDTSEKLESDGGRLLNPQGKVLVWFDHAWKWQLGRQLLEASLTNQLEAVVAVASIPMDASASSPLEPGFKPEAERCDKVWQNILNDGMTIETPEEYVNNAWRSLVAATFSLINGNLIFYSAGNQYEKLYEQEGSAAMLALLGYGHETDARRLMVPLLKFTRKGLEFHQAGHKLDDVCRYYWQTRDADFVRSIRPLWQKEVDLLAEHRSPTNGLYPREQYCGDIPTPVFSLNSNAKGWRALRDTSALLDALGDSAEAGRVRKIADDFRRDILVAVKKSKVDDSGFVPNALLGEELPYGAITSSRMGSYWNLMANNILGTEVFGQGDPEETGLMHYFQEHGGLCMGLVRARAWPGFWTGSANLNPLYGWFYVRTLLRRDEPERALVSFYGMLAAGLTPDTFTCGEACALQPLDQWGRQFYCPPNSAGNAFFLQMLRSLLVQDWDLNDDGQPDTLRLLFATPRRWLADGQTITVEHAPTAFGPVSLRVQSLLSRGLAVADVSLPDRNPPDHCALRLRLPGGWRAVSASAQGKDLSVDHDGTVDLSGMKGHMKLEFKVERL